MDHPQRSMDRPQLFFHRGFGFMHAQAAHINGVAAGAHG